MTEQQTAEGKEKIQGTVKWFSNKKGYGFITPSEGSVTEDVFVHQSSIHSQGYRTLDEGWNVEFTIGDDDGGRVKAENVTAPGGGPCTGPHRRRDNRNRRKKTEENRDADADNHEEPHDDGEEGRENTNGNRRGRRDGRSNRRNGNKSGGGNAEGFWHSILVPEVKAKLEEKSIRTSTGTIDISVGSARVKLGTQGYSSVAHADGLLGEGTFLCDEQGTATLEWSKCLECKNGEWVLKTGDFGLVTKLSLTDDNVLPVKSDETAVTLWGEKPDPLESLEKNGFLMRRVVLTTKRNVRNRK